MPLDNFDWKETLQKLKESTQRLSTPPPLNSSLHLRNFSFFNPSVDRNNLFWKKGDWKSSRVDNDGNISRGNKPWTSGSYNDSTNQYKWGGDRGKALEENQYYNYEVQGYVDESGNLTDQGKKWLSDNYIENSTDKTGTLMKQLIAARDNNYQFPTEGIKRVNANTGKLQTLTNWKDFIIGNNEVGPGVAMDFVYSKAHNRNTGIGVYDNYGRVMSLSEIKNLYPDFDPDQIMNSDKIPDYLKYNSSEDRLLQSQSTNGIKYYRLLPPNGQSSNRQQAIASIMDEQSSSTPTDEQSPSTLDEYIQKIKGEINGEKPPEDDEDDDSGGGGDGTGNFTGSRTKGPLNPTFLDALRLAADNLFNIRNTNAYKKALRPGLENHSPSYKQVFGDEKAKWQGRQQAARLINRTPLTSNAQLQTASDLEAIAKGNQYIQQGENKDAETYWKTSELAFQQAKENTNAWQNVANRNYKSLTDYSNKLAELDYQANKDNMQNIDKFVAEQSKRLWDKYDYYDYRRMLNQEKNDELYDKYNGVAGDLELLKEYTRKYDEALLNVQNSSSEDQKKQYQSAATLLRHQLDHLANKIEVQQHINRLIRTDPEGWRRSFNTLYEKWLGDQGIDASSIKKIFGWKFGGKFQSGGSFGVSYTSAAGAGNPYLQALTGKSSASSASKKKDQSSSDSSSDDNSKQKDKLLNGIAETLKGIDGLNSDVNTLYQELNRFFDVQQYNLSDDPTQLYQMYIKALNRVNQVKQSAKQFDNAYKAMEKTGSIVSPAIDSNGYVYVGIPGTNQIDKVSPIEYVQNKNKYKLLRNNELLELRKNSSAYAFADQYITEAAYNGTSMQEISKFIKEILGKVGTDQESRDMIVRQYGQSAIEGLQQLQYLAQNQFATGETASIIAGLKGALSEVNLTTKSQIQQAELGIKTIIAMMPANMRSLLIIQGDSPDSVEKLVAGYVFSGLDTSIDFKFKDVTTLDANGNPTGSSKSGSSSGSGSDKDPKETTASKWVHGYGEKSTFAISTGTNKAWVVTGNTLPLTDPSDHNLGQATLAEATKAFGGVLDLSHAVMGNQRISSLGLSQVLLETSDITMVALPIDTSAEYTRPAFSRLKKLSEAEQELKRMNIDVELKERLSAEQKAKVNEVYKSKELDPLFDQNGNINKLKYAYFGLVKGIAKETAFEENGDLEPDYLIKATSQERKLFEDTMKQMNGKGGFDLDNGWLWGMIGRDEVYRGTIFIPIRTNIFNSQSGYGSSYSGTPTQNLDFDTKQQYTDEIKSKGIKPVGKTNFNIQ